MARAKRKNTTAFAKTADVKLFKLEDEFTRAYMGVLQNRSGAGAGSVPTGTKKEKATFRKLERAVDIATEKAYAVIEAPAFTLEGILMKIHVAGFAFDRGVKPDTYSAPYHGMICKDGPQHWDVVGATHDHPELTLIDTLRDDLHRLVGKRH